jgi:hypothetical protein
MNINITDIIYLIILILLFEKMRGRNYTLTPYRHDEMNTPDTNSTI